MKLDLHGIKHQDVKQIVDSFVWEAMKNKSHQIEIITGVSSDMKYIVKETLSEYGFDPIPDLVNDGFLTFHMNYLI